MRVPPEAAPMPLTVRVKGKESTAEYAEKLVQDGNAYYAFDTPEELEIMRTLIVRTANPSPQYDHQTRMHMRNSLTLGPAETRKITGYQIPFRNPDQNAAKMKSCT